MGETVNDSDERRSPGAALVALEQLTAKLRVECPWDREQTLGSIVPHTVEEAYEVADAARNVEQRGADPAELIDELGDLLFQVVLLTRICSEGHPDVTLTAVIESIHDKLVHRHPHIFGEANADSADEVRALWDSVKRAATPSAPSGLFDSVSRSLPSYLYAQKLQQRAASVGFDFPTLDPAIDKLREEAAEVSEAAGAVNVSSSEQWPVDPAVESEVGDLLFAAVNVARLTRSDSESALRESADRFRARVERAQQLAADDGVTFSSLNLEMQERYYQQAKRLL